MKTAIKLSVKMTEDKKFAALSIHFYQLPCNPNQSILLYNSCSVQLMFILVMERKVYFDGGKRQIKNVYYTDRKKKMLTGSFKKSKDCKIYENIQSNRGA